MAFIFSREKTLGGQRKIQQYMIVALLLVLLVTIFIIWKGFKKDGSSKGQYASPRVYLVKKVEIDFGVLQDKIFEQLENPPSAISIPPLIGRSNPFIPF